ncbi:putative metallo-beta-lactamase domain-containing protein-like [Balamuthia mandrillaris]
MENNKEEADRRREDELHENEWEVVFMGTGSSGMVPRPSCLLAEPRTCRVCDDAHENPDSKNRRLNTSLLFRFRSFLPEEAEEEGGRSDGITAKRSKVYNVLIDCGKSFREASLRWMIKYKVKSLDAVLLTHDHADATLGLDDLREWTRHTSNLPIYLVERDLDALSRVFPYLVDSRKATGSGYVASLTFNVIQPNTAFEVGGGLSVMPIEVHHGTAKGQPYTCLGFRFGNIAYISDCSAIPESAASLLVRVSSVSFILSFFISSSIIPLSSSVRVRCLPSPTNFPKKQEGLDVLVLDAISPGEGFNSHLTVKESLEEVRRLRPKKTYFVGMNHDIEYDQHEAEMQTLKESEGLDVSFAYDGLRFRIAM